LRWQELPRFSARSKDDPAGAKPATPLLSLRWTLRAKRASVVVTDSKPDGFAPLPRQRRWQGSKRPLLDQVMSSVRAMHASSATITLTIDNTHDLLAALSAITGCGV